MKFPCRYIPNEATDVSTANSSSQKKHSSIISRWNLNSSFRANRSSLWTWNIKNGTISFRIEFYLKFFSVSCLADSQLLSSFLNNTYDWQLYKTKNNISLPFVLSSFSSKKKSFYTLMSICSLSFFPAYIFSSKFLFSLLSQVWSQVLFKKISELISNE